MTPESYLPVSWRPKKISEDETEMEAPEPLPVKKITAMDGVQEEPTELEKFLGVSTGPMKVAETQPLTSQDQIFKKLSEVESLRKKKAYFDFIKSQPEENQSLFGPIDRKFLSKEESDKLSKVTGNPLLQQEMDRYLRKSGLGTSLIAARKRYTSPVPRFAGGLPQDLVWNPMKWWMRNYGG